MSTKESFIEAFKFCIISFVELMKSLKAKASRLKGEVTALYYAFKDRALGPLPKILIGLTLGYALSPIDLIPDFIPIIGYLDDLIILPFLIWLTIKMIPDTIMESARKKAEKCPLILKKNIPAALIIATIWISLISLIIYRIID